MSQYTVRSLAKKDICVNVPGSKSITNRALMTAALGDGISHVSGIQRSDDSEHFIDCLKKLGYEIEDNADSVVIKGNNGMIPNKKADIYVGSAGTAARFLTAMLAMSDGEYVIDASEQMQKRPMRELIEALESIGARFDFLKEPYALPFKVKGMGTASTKAAGTEVAGAKTTSAKTAGTACSDELKVDINIDKSSQYLSALMMAAPMTHKKMSIHLTGGRKARSYVVITQKVMKQFGVDVMHENEDEYVIPAGASYSGTEYFCEPDISAACYFYAMAAACGARAVVRGVHADSMQGDIRFLDILLRMGCEVSDTDEGICVTGPETLKGITVDMSDFSDQALTLAAIAPFTDTGVTITGIGHIKNQESDRIMSMYNELDRMGIRCTAYDDGIKIKPGHVKPALIQTYNDHRVAMSFAVTGLAAEGITIDNPECCRKTFPEYFHILDTICN